MTKRLQFTGVVANQSKQHIVVSFPALAKDLIAIADIHRAGRRSSGVLEGFQRPRIANHIKEIRTYLLQPDAILPNSIVIAFSEGITVEKVAHRIVTVSVDCEKGPQGLIVDGQQRLNALTSSGREDFEIFVSAFITNSEDELRRQFILINNTRPLPKSLIYELIPTVSGLPSSMKSRSFASKLAARLNFETESSLFRQIYMHTNPEGVIKDTSIQKVIMTSARDGALRELKHLEDFENRAFNLISNFYQAVQNSFPQAWRNQTPKTSRLVHRAGITAMGYVMEYLYARDSASQIDEFERGILPLIKCAAWTGGNWHFPDGEVRPWNGVQNVGGEIRKLTDYLLRVLRNAPAASPVLSMRVSK